MPKMWKSYLVAHPVPTKTVLSTAEIEKLPPFTSTDAALKFKQRAVHLWLLDFNQVEPIGMDDGGVEMAVRAFWLNDPYYPRPVPTGDKDERLWECFREEYLKQSKRCADGKPREGSLPEKSVRGLWVRRREEGVVELGVDRLGADRLGGRELPVVVMKNLSVMQIRGIRSD